MNVPAKLRSQDIAKFAQRAAQLEKIKPAISYWAYYWIVKQVLGKGLHNADAECTTYTTHLMDKLEQMKSQYPSDDAIADDVAGQAYVEQFGQETFQRADNAVRANKASKQTAETFQAAATFLELVQVWGPPSPEIAAKIKFAKFHAIRILKAIRAGEDPNLSNPVPEIEPEATEVPLDPNDPEVRQITGDAPYQPTVEDLPDQQDTSQAAGSEPPAQPTYDVSPPQQPSVNSRQNSVGGGYFPEVSPSSQPAAAAGQDIDIPTPPPLDDAPPIVPDLRDFDDVPSSTTAIPPPVTYQAPVIPPVAPPPIAPQRAPARPHALPPAAVAPVQDVQPYIDDDVAVAEAQKHARWAISALNFEDVPTAIKELRIALQKLGAT